MQRQKTKVAKKSARGRFGLALSLVSLLAMVLASLPGTGLGEYIDASITRPLYFHAREAAGRDPRLDPKLKIFSYDDGSVDRLQRPELTIDDWAIVLEGIAKNKPRVILIDKVFSILFDPMNQKRDALQRLARIKVPIVAGAFAVDAEKKTRNPLTLTGPDYTIRFRRGAGDPPPFSNYFGWYVYGPHAELTSVLSGAGHLLYYDNGKISAYLQVAPQKIVPHLSLYAAEEQLFTHGKLLIDGVQMPLDSQGRTIVNFSHLDRYYDRHKRLGPLVQAARQGEPLKGIEAGDTVLLLPEMYTGSTDFKMTPVGIMPGGFILATMVNSVISGAWVREVPYVALQVLLLILVGSAWAIYAPSLSFWLGMLVASGVWSGVGIYLFTTQGLLLSLALPLAGLWCSAMVTFAERTLSREEEARRVQTELDDAAEMARAFRPEERPSWNGLEIASFHQPYSEASGDWYAFCASPSGRFKHFVLCDITGHGVQAALVVSMCKTVLALTVREHPELLESEGFMPAYAETLNALLFQHGNGKPMLTFLGMSFETPAPGQNATLHYVCAGHPFPIMIQRGVEARLRPRALAGRSSLLGTRRSVSMVLHRVQLARGDEVLAFTDGLPLGRNVRALTGFLVANDARAQAFDGAPERLLRHIWRSEQARSGRHLEDDVSIVWFKAA